MVDLSQTPALSADRPKKGIKVANGENRLQENLVLDGGVRIDIKVLSKDTNGDLSILLSSNNMKASGPPVHIHPDFDETFYITSGEVKFKVGDEIFQLKTGDSIFIPRNVPHAFTITSDTPGAFLIVSQPAGQFENFMIAYSKFYKITPEIATKLMIEYNMEVVGPPLAID
jgi:quercetin dioxygenase-like cupin family protein